MNPKPLFVDGDLGATLRAQREKALRAVDEVPEARFRSTDPSELASDVYARFHVEPAVLTEGAISVEAEEADIDRRRFMDIDHGFPGASPTLRGMRVVYNVPFTGDRTLFQLKPSRWTTVFPYAVLEASALRFVYEVRSSEVKGTRKAFDKDLALTKQYLGWGQDEVLRFNEELARAIESTVDARTSRLAEASEGLASLGLPVRATEPARVTLPQPVVSKERTAAPEKGRYDVALSFAGEDRKFVEEVAHHLKDAGVRVFYDRFESAQLWGKDLVAHLQDIYQNRAQYCVIFISEHYVSKPWPRHERQSAQARALVADEEYLLPARFDDAELPGLPGTIGFVDLREMSPVEFSQLVLEKLGKEVE